MQCSSTIVLDIEVTGNMETATKGERDSVKSNYVLVTIYIHVYYHNTTNVLNQGFNAVRLTDTTYRPENITYRQGSWIL